MWACVCVCWDFSIVIHHTYSLCSWTNIDFTILLSDDQFIFLRLFSLPLFFSLPPFVGCSSRNERWSENGVGKERETRHWKEKWQWDYIRHTLRDCDWHEPLTVSSNISGCCVAVDENTIFVKINEKKMSVGRANCNSMSTENVCSCMCVNVWKRLSTEMETQIMVSTKCNHFVGIKWDQRIRAMTNDLISCGTSIFIFLCIHVGHVGLGVAHCTQPTQISIEMESVECLMLIPHCIWWSIK